MGCDSCGLYPIKGRRYKCQDCPDKVGFDLCGKCYDRGLHITGRFNQQHIPGATQITSLVCAAARMAAILAGTQTLHLRHCLKAGFCFYHYASPVSLSPCALPVCNEPVPPCHKCCAAARPVCCSKLMRPLWHAMQSIRWGWSIPNQRCSISSRSGLHL